MARKKRTKKHAKVEVTKKPQENSKSEDLKDKKTDNTQRKKQAKLSKGSASILIDKQENSGAHVVGTVGGIIGGTMMGSLVWPMMMLFYGPILGSTIGAGVAGVSGVAIQNVLSKHVQLLKIILPLFAILFLPPLFYIVIGTSTLEYVQENISPSGMISLD